MNILASIAVVIIALACIGYGALAYGATMMSDAPTGIDKGGCVSFVIGLALFGLAVWIAWP